MIVLYQSLIERRDRAAQPDTQLPSSALPWAAWAIC